MRAASIHISWAKRTSSAMVLRALQTCLVLLVSQQLRSLAWKFGSETESFERGRQGLEDADEWRLWKSEQARLYASSTEELERYVIWRSNKAYIESHNEYSQEFGYTVRMNKFGDLVRQGCNCMSSGLYACSQY